MTHATAAPRAVEVRSLTVGYDVSAPPIASSITFDVAASEVLAIVGPSGCGKTTILRAIAGLIQPWQGTIRVGGAPVDGPGADRGLVSQHGALFPWLTAADNVAFGLRLHPQNGRAIGDEVAEMLRRVGLSGSAARHYPNELSGGMQQRVSLARALVLRPPVLLLDEPFSSLDALSREDMQSLLLELQGQLGTTMILVTHDVDEAVRLAHHVVVLGERPATVHETVAVHASREERMADAWIDSRKAEAASIRRLVRELAAARSTSSRLA
jgi:ABC-type nitrate/sulfonate/bicarbonate transport system ATPase subunit